MQFSLSLLLKKKYGFDTKTVTYLFPKLFTDRFKNIFNIFK